MQSINEVHCTPQMHKVSKTAHNALQYRAITIFCIEQLSTQPILGPQGPKTTYNVSECVCVCVCEWWVCVCVCVCVGGGGGGQDVNSFNQFQFYALLDSGSLQNSTVKCASGFMGSPRVAIEGQPQCNDKITRLWTVNHGLTCGNSSPKCRSRAPPRIPQSLMHQASPPFCVIEHESEMFQSKYILNHLVFDDMIQFALHGTLKHGYKSG